MSLADLADRADISDLESDALDVAVDLFHALREGPKTQRLSVTRVSASAYELRVRLLELGLIPGARFEASLRGAQIMIKLRGDLLIMRRAEAEQLLVSTEIPRSHLTAGEV